MGGLNSLLDPLLPDRYRRVLMLGLVGSGKTSALYQLGAAADRFPMLCYNVEMLLYENMQITSWDVDGASKPRFYIRDHFRGLHALIYVVDSSDKSSIGKAKDILDEILALAEMPGDVNVLIYANKQDQAAMSIAEITERLGLEGIKGRKWYVQGSCTLIGQGLTEGLDWLTKSLGK